jgi:arylsulfate sulfotransferase
MRYLRPFLICFFAMILFVGCKKDKTAKLSDAEFSILNKQVALNPTGYSPLTATISIETSIASRVSIKVSGKNGKDSDVIRDFSKISKLHDIPILGLYPDFANIVEIVFFDMAGIETGRFTDTVNTGPLPEGVFPKITIDTKKEGDLAKGMTLVNYYGFKDSAAPQFPFIFDAFGDIRWYLDFRNHPVLNKLSYDNGPERLENGNLYFGDKGTNTIYEVNMTGEIIKSWPLTGFAFHHNVQEKPNGNFLVTVDKTGSSTIEDFIIEIDRNSKQIIRTWDLNSSLQYSREALISNPVDWVHVNAVIYDPADNTIIVSGRTQGLVKLDENNNVVWIMGSHRGWGNSGSGADLNNYLLQPIDKNDIPIADADVQDGAANHPEFQWNWYQHAPLLKPDGHIMLFDNGGENRNFTAEDSYSRAVEYEINAANKTVKQIWDYGQDRGLETYSKYVSDVDYLPEDNHVIFSPGGINSGGVIAGKIVEINYDTQEILFEVTITPNPGPGICFHRTERLSLYP